MMNVCEWCGAEYPGTIGAAIIDNEYAFICPGCEDKWRCEQIPIGRGNAISREALAARWRMPDRMARRTIARLRAEPIDARYAILSTSRAPHGYWRSDDAEEIAAFIRETGARAKSTFAALRGAKRVMRRILSEGQTRMEGTEG